MELLVTVAIIAMFFAIAGVQAVKVFQRQKLVVAAQEIEQFAQRAYIETQRRSRAVFLYLDARAADGTTPLMLIEDTNQDGDPDVGTDTTIATYVIQTNGATDERDVSLSATDTSQVETTNWSDDSTSATARWLRVDFLARTFNGLPTTTAQSQIAGMATLSITHPRMVGGSAATLTPLVNYQLRIAPVWNAKIQRPIL